MSTAQTRAAAFDGIAAQYDDLFTNSLIGRIQRNAVWRIAKRYLRPGNLVLELSCGTGEDAFFLANSGMKVHACDISAKMIEIAKWRKLHEFPGTRVEFQLLATENIADLPRQTFNAAFSNFSGLNCVADLRKTAADLAGVLRPGSPAVLCFCNKFCLWEVLWYLFHGNAHKAFRRWASQPITAHIGDEDIAVYYPSIDEIVSSFSPYFCLIGAQGIGIAVPPSYLEPWARRMPRVTSMLMRLDHALSGWPLIRSIGDHVVVVLQRMAR